jgi:DeoR/GlpR family transcriptional regulator of sugar metabolism
VIVIADGSKVGAATPIVVGPAEQIATLVTDASAPNDELGRLRALGVEVVIAERIPPASTEPIADVRATVGS